MAIPDDAASVRVAAIITGHNGCEFQPTSHHFVVGGVDFNTSSSKYTLLQFEPTTIQPHLNSPQCSLVLVARVPASVQTIDNGNVLPEMFNVIVECGFGGQVLRSLHARGEPGRVHGTRRGPRERP